MSESLSRVYLAFFGLFIVASIPMVGQAQYAPLGHPIHEKRKGDFSMEWVVDVCPSNERYNATCEQFERGWADIVSEVSRGRNPFGRHTRADVPQFAISSFVVPAASDMRVGQAFDAAPNAVGSTIGWWAVCYEGVVNPTESGKYRFFFGADDKILVFVDGELVVNGALESEKYGAWFRLKKGAKHSIKIIFANMRTGSKRGAFMGYLLIQKEVATDPSPFIMATLTEDVVNETRERLNQIRLPVAVDYNNIPAMNGDARKAAVRKEISDVLKEKPQRKVNAAMPKHVTLLKKTSHPIKHKGKVVGSKPFAKGTVLEVVSVKDDILKVRSGGDVFTCKRDYTDYDKRYTELKLKEELGDIKADNSKRFERLLNDEQRVEELRSKLDSFKVAGTSLAEFYDSQSSEVKAFKVAVKIGTFYAGKFSEEKDEYLSFSLREVDQKSPFGYGYIKKESPVGKKLVAVAGDFKEHEMIFKLSIPKDKDAEGDDRLFVIEDYLDAARAKAVRDAVKRLEDEIKFLKGERKSDSSR